MNLLTIQKLNGCLELRKSILKLEDFYVWITLMEWGGGDKDYGDRLVEKP